MKTKFIIFLLALCAIIVVSLALFFTKDNTTRVEPVVPNAPTSTPPVVTSTPTLIRVTAPFSNEVVSSPLRLVGEARGNWYFEASFPVRVIDANGTVLAHVPVQANGEWVTTDFVPFSTTATFTTATAATGFVIFEKDNPSGLPENAAEYRVPVRFESFVVPVTTTVKVFFNNSQLVQAGQDECVLVFPVQREIPYTVGVARAALEELLKGPNAQEKNFGYATSLNAGIKVQSITIENGVAKVDFDKKLDEAVGGSCRVINIRRQIIETLKQFATIKDVVISIDGRTEDILQP